MLISFDDYPVHQTAAPLAHTGGGHPDHYDRFWFNGYSEDYYFAIALGIYPNRGLIDAAFSVVHEGVQRSVFTSARLTSEPTNISVGPISIEIVEPMRVARIRVDAPQQALHADLVCTARTVAVEEPRATRYVGSTLTYDVTRATQMVQWAGKFTSGSHGIELPASGVVGTKDRSWGVRPVGQPAPAAPQPASGQMFFLWAPINFEDKALHYMVLEDSAGQAWSKTAVEMPVIGPGDSVISRSQDVATLNMHHRIDWAPGLRCSRRAALTIDDGEAGEQLVKLTPLFTFRMSGAGYFHPEWSHGTWKGELVVGGEEATTESLNVLRPDTVHVQQIVRAHWGDRTGLGVLEQLVLGPHVPSGFVDQLDGAPLN